MRHVSFLAATLIASLSGAYAADPVKIPFEVIEKGFKTAECTNDLKPEDTYNAEDLSGGLVIVEIYCWRAAYQAGSIFFAVDPKAPEKARLLEFPFPSRKGFKKQYSLTTAEYGGGTMSSAHKGRGVGDCGDIGEWKWSGKDFKLAKYWSKPKCDGNPFDNNRRWQVYPPRR